MCPTTAPFIFLHASAYSQSQHTGVGGGMLDVSTTGTERACLLQNVI